MKFERKIVILCGDETSEIHEDQLNIVEGRSRGGEDRD